MIKILFLLAVGCIFGGCAPAIRTQQIDIKSSTEGSKIAVYDKNNNKVLESGSSMTAYLEIGSAYRGGGVYLVEITKDGYEPLTTLIGPDFNTGLSSGSILWWGPVWTMGNLSPRIINADLESGAITVFNRSDWYSAIRYGMPLGGLPQWGHINVENGRIWRNGAFLGTEFDFGLGYSDEKKGEMFRLMIGYGFDAGGVYDLPVDENLKLVYGGAVGYWFVYEEYDQEKFNFNFLAPFIKLRYNILELSYRGLLGVSVKERRYEYYDRYYGGYDYEYDIDSKFGWNNHQLTLGLYFEGSKRKGVTLQRR